MAHRDSINEFCNELLYASEYRDIALNGLQIEGRSEISSLTIAVSANQHSIDAAVAAGSDALLVHHGVVLNGQIGEIRGPVRQRLKGLLANDINLIAYHLPLDGHPQVGNNAQLIQKLGLTCAEALETFGPPAIGYIAEPEETLTVDALISRVERVTEQNPIHLPGGPSDIRRIAVLSGSGYSALDEAAEKGCQVLITGDAREPTMAAARELGVSVLVAGHEATERLGVQALAKRLAKEFDVEQEYVPDPNPL